MCGFVALFAHAPSAPAVDDDELLAIRDHMRARGPDGQGSWRSDDGRVALGHRRLSIIDLSEGGAQPLAGSDPRIQVVYNGEIYNHAELRAELEDKGHSFRSTSDTEVLVRLYEEYGETFVKRLRGMYALALWDGRDGRLLLARDPFGIKPLYVAATGGVVRVASQVKALLAGGGVSREPDPAGTVGLFLWGTVPEPYTLYRDVRALPPGSYAWVDEAGLGPPVTWWTPTQAYEPAAAAPVLDSDGVREQLLESMRYHLVSDVPVGVFLSAGVDSTVMAALACELGNGPVRTLNVSFEEFDDSPRDERVFAEQTAERLGTDHTTVRVTAREAKALMDQVAEAMDQPSIDGLNSFLVSKAAHDAGLKVALSGLGGDELFGGYPSFDTVPSVAKAMRVPARIPGAGRLFRSAAGLLPDGRRREKLRGLVEFGGTLPGAYYLQRGLFMPWELPELLGADLVEAGLAAYDPVQDARSHAPHGASAWSTVAALEQCMYMRNQLLRDTDWASMAWSLEVRVPLVDRTLHDALASTAAATFQPGAPKRLLAGVPHPPLPAAWLDRQKTGFHLPMRDWMDAMGVPARWGQAWARDWLSHLYERHLGSTS